MSDPLREQLERAGCPVASDDTVVMYHATSVAGAKGILSEKMLRPAANDAHVFVSTTPAIASVLPESEVVIAVRARLNELAESGDWLDHEDAVLRRIDYAVAVDNDGVYRPVAIGREAYDA